MNNSRRTAVLIGVGLAFVVSYMFLIDLILPPKPPAPTPPESRFVAKARDNAFGGAMAGFPMPLQETVMAVGGGMVGQMPVMTALDRIEKPSQEAVEVLAGGVASGDALVRSLRRDGRPVPPEPPKIVPPPPLGDLIALGHSDKQYYVQALLNTRGGSVQQVTLTEFDESDREGLRVVRNGKPQKLNLVPGVYVPRSLSVRDQRKIVESLPQLSPGPISPEIKTTLSPPSFRMFHYEKPDDERPVDTLGEAQWKVIKQEVDTNAEEQTVTFETELAEPHNLRIRKTFTLKHRDYHIGLSVHIQRLDGKTGPNQFRYQLVGANGLPIEGEWYTTTFRQAIVGFSDDRGRASRYIEDAATVRVTEGGERQTRTDKIAIRYAAVAVQYFASAIAVDNEQDNRNFVEFVRATPVNEYPPLRAKVQGKEPKDWQFWEFLDDVTVRSITEAFNPADTTHKYMLYHGPLKVRLLGLMPDKIAVDDKLVERYRDELTLSTLTDAPMPNALGRFANAIYWTDAVVMFTNIVHYLLWGLYQIAPERGICIILVTLMMRLMLFPLSRRQAHSGMVMQAKMAKMQPEIRKLQEKYGSDYQGMNAAKMQLYREHKVNPLGAMGGCFLLLLQMPMLTGLYFALQESVFFRLDSFLWVPNLAAPDMTIWWTERIPFISSPEDMGSSLYLGPYFNVLPVIAVCLMMYQQQKMMPVSDDPQVQSQQKMMKYMMIFFGFMFYKVAAGLCIYFIIGSLWGLIERRFMPKATKPDENGETAAPPPPQPYAGNNRRDEVEEQKPLGWWGKKKKEWGAKWKDVLEQAQKQQEFRRTQEPPDRTKKKKKKR